MIILKMYFGIIFERIIRHSIVQFLNPLIKLCYMRYNFTLFFLLLLLGFTSLKVEAQIINNITKPSLTIHSLAEKIYLQLDNTIYQTGETIWFKTVVSRSYDNSLSDISEVLHVELIDFNETLVEKKILKLKGGIASGSFELQKGYKSGKYLIRAYTHWNRNFEEDFMFTQSIDVLNLDENKKLKNPIINVAVTTDSINTLSADINPRVLNPNHKGKLQLYIDTGKSIDTIELKKNKENIYKLNYRLPEKVTQAELKFNTQASGKIFEANTPDSYSKTIVIDKDYLDVQFFPEGGKLVNGLLSTVAFKAIDYQGLGYEISGLIKDGKGNDITSFNSNNLGLGTFKLLPKTGSNYYAEVSVNDVIYRYSLPIAKTTGNVLSVVRLKDDIRLLLVSNTKSKTNIKIQTESRGIKYHDLSFKSKDTITTSISSKSLPEGIIKITVLNDKAQIISERLVFNTKLNKRLKLNIESDRTSYSQREKTTLKIQLDSLQEPEGTNLSVLVIDKEKVDASKSYKPNLISHLLLSSELKGFIENPRYYFNDNNKSRALDLDALLLSQGWRNYKYQNSIASTNYIYKPEKRLVVSGTIGEYFNPKKRPKKPLDLNMIVYGETEDIYKQEIDSSGRYYFELEDLYKPRAELFMQVVNKKGEPIDFGINLDKKWNPEIKLRAEQTIELPSQIISTFTERIEADNKIQRDYEVAHNTIALDEVKLRDYKLTPAREKSIELHGEPTYVIDGEEFIEVAPDWNFGVYSVLKAKYPDKIRIRTVHDIPPWYYAKVWNSDITLVLIDNIPVYYEDYDEIQNIPADEVSSIDIIESARDVYRYVFEIFGTGNVNFGTNRVSYLNIYTKSGNGLYGITKAKGVLTDYVSGYSKDAEFYAPNYETLTNQDWVIPDNRSVIHWSPDITLNSKGEYILEYYNDDHIGEVSVIVEAISKDGKIGYLEKTYTLRKAER